MNMYKEKSRGLSTENIEMIHRVGYIGSRESTKGTVSRERMVDDSIHCKSQGELR